LTTSKRTPCRSRPSERTIAVVIPKNPPPISFAEADRLAAEDDSPFARAFRETLNAGPAVRRLEFVGGAK